MRTHGQALLGAIGQDQAEIAETCGVQQPVVSMWLSGRRPPTLKHKESLRKAYGIPLSSWDVPEKEVVAKEERGLIEVPAVPASNERDGEARLRSVLQQLDRVKRDPNLSPKDLMKLAQTETQVQRQLSAINGELAVISPAKILQSQAWKEIEAVLVEELSKVPDAMMRIADRLRAL